METFIQQFLNGLAQGATYALIALGYTMVYGVLRLINFAHGDVYMVGAFAGFFIARGLGIGEENPSVIGAVAVTLGAMAVCAVLGILIERLAYKPVRKHSRLTSLITAIGVSLLLEFGGQVVFTPNPRPFPLMIPNHAIALGPFQITNAIASRYVDCPYPTAITSARPMISPPTIAPGMLPMPPSTAATNAFSPGMIPISGSIRG